LTLKEVNSDLFGKLAWRKKDKITLPKGHCRNSRLILAVLEILVGESHDYDLCSPVKEQEHCLGDEAEYGGIGWG